MSLFALYVHWPFCQAKCPYCDFNSHVTAHVDQDRWGRALVSEIRRAREETGSRRLSSIFFGGGTPSLMDPRVVDRIIAAAEAAWPFAPDIEISLEANPTSVEADRFRGYRTAGVTRVSLGVQSLVDADLRRLGRRHDAAEALAAIDTARRVFDRVSFDLIYARQDQSVDDWRAELRQALSLAPDHLSLYQLTIEPGTAFHDRLRRGGLAGLPNDDLGADLWDVTQTLCDDAGLPAYEISNHAVPGAECRHNLTYWTNADWVGVGPGAHGRFGAATGRVATETILSPGPWLTAVETEGSGESARRDLSPREVAEDNLMMGLRLREGVESRRLEALHSDYFFNEIKALRDFGLLAEGRGSLTATMSGRPVLNSILRQLLSA